VLPKSSLEIVGMSWVIGTVGTAQQVNPELHRCCASALRLRSGRTNARAWHRESPVRKTQSRTYPQTQMLSRRKRVAAYVRCEELTGQAAP
jgi:hypothetical protein